MPTGGYEGTPSRAGGGLPGGARSVDPGHLLIALGAIMLLVSLFLEWYTPNAEAWDVFEVWDLVLAALAILALMTVAGRLGFGPPRPASWLIAASAAALVIVLYALIDPPPVVQGGEGFGDPSTGLWLALAGVILMVAGTVLSFARISVAFNAARPGVGDHRGGHGRHVDPDGSNPAVPQPPRAGEPGYAERAGSSTEPTRRI